MPSNSFFSPHAGFSLLLLTASFKTENQSCMMISILDSCEAEKHVDRASIPSGVLLIAAIVGSEDLWITIKEGEKRNKKPIL
jgi:hypothetical protein